MAWVLLTMSAIVAGITEEFGFRGYSQVTLEKSFGSKFSIILTSLIFMLIHIGQAWAPPILIHIFLLGVMFGYIAYATNSLIPGIVAHALVDVFNFSYWWSNVAGEFDRKPIGTTGLDLHFVFWLVLLLLSAVVFVWLVRRTITYRNNK